MRTLLTLIATALFSTAALAAGASVDAPAPDFSGTDAFNGKVIHLSDFKGKLVVLEWNNFQCPFVRKFYGAEKMQQLQADAKKDGVVWITINSSAAGKEGYLASDDDAKQAAIEHHSHAAHYLRDASGEIGHAYGAKSTPHMFVINKEGTLVYAGAIDDKPSPYPEDLKDAHNYVTAALAALKAGKPIEHPATQAYGCFVKY